MPDDERVEFFAGWHASSLMLLGPDDRRARGARRTLKLPGKGHGEEVETFLQAIREGWASLIPLRSLALTSGLRVDSLCIGLPQVCRLEEANRR